ncbi:MAG: anion transporter [Crocinitomicaceae bacterium]|nr:anion transporter [Crocinitomicaceae bacterium]|tara:strand:+ start:979 stop:2403 length:1425 start_codon:yes stop_codon:yes gene_type:complete
MKLNGIWRLLLGPVVAALVWLASTNFGLSEQATPVLSAGAWMLVWWIAEAVPLGVTSVLPMVLFPMLGISSISETTAPYGSHYVFLFMGGFLIAIALERWNLHRRFALNILVLAGGKPRRLIGGFMLATAALSMWISNTATTLMMLPIALSVASKVNEKEHPRFAMVLLLATAYAANLGGIATLVGTPPNVAMAGIMEEQFSFSMPFLEWMILAFPFSVFMLLLVYLLLTRVLCRVSNSELTGGIQGIQNELQSLGKWQPAEQRVAAVFLLTGIFWVSRRWLVSSLGWELNDTTIAMLAGTILFVIPAGATEDRALLTWEDTKRLPWDILLLFGGGLTLAKALNDAEVLPMVAESIAGNDTFSIPALIGIFTFSALMLTEVMSNLALTVVMVPVVGQVAINLGIDPLVLVVPVTMASSCAFMLPMATPPNAIIFGSNRISMGSMASVGIVLNCVAAMVAWLWAIFVLPIWLEMI